MTLERLSIECKERQNLSLFYLAIELLVTEVTRFYEKNIDRLRDFNSRWDCQKPPTHFIHRDIMLTFFEDISCSIDVSID